MSRARATSPTVGYRPTAWRGFDSLIALHAHPVSGALYCAEQKGCIYRLSSGSAAGAAEERELVWDVRPWLVRLNPVSEERGLLDFAFDPAGAHLFCVLSTPLYRQTRGVRYYNVLLRLRADRSGRVEKEAFGARDAPVLFAIPKRNTFHQGGRLLVDARSDSLLLSVGDDGPQGDPGLHGQDLAVPWAKIWRFSLARLLREDAAERSAQPRVFAYGLRNVWSMALLNEDAAAPAQRQLVLGDVGYNTREEVDVLPLAGVQSRGAAPWNLGWPLFEGAFRTDWWRPRDAPALQAAWRRFEADARAGRVVAPAFEYATRPGRSVIVGGPLARGLVMGDLSGLLLYLEERASEEVATSSGPRFRLRAMQSLPRGRRT